MLVTWGIANHACADGLYGRFDTSSTLSLASGASFGLNSVDQRIQLEFSGEWRFIGSSGPFVEMRTDFDSIEIGGGVVIRPLFPALFLLGAQIEHRWWALAFESLSLRLSGGLDSASRPYFRIATSVDLPIVHSIFLRFGGGYQRDFQGAHGVLTAALAIDLDIDEGGANAEPARY